MSEARGSHAVDGHKPENDDHRSLLRIAARLLYAKEHEEEGTEELVQLAEGIRRIIMWRRLICVALFCLFSAFLLLAFLVWIAIVANGFDPGNRPVAVILPLATGVIGCVLYWRNLQYDLKFGLGPIQKARPAIYGSANRATTETVEKLFAYLGRRTAPRAYYVTRDGNRRYLSRYFFWGSLRGLLFSEEPSDRAIVSPPYGFWFSGAIKIEAEPEAIIAALKVRPKAGGRPKEIDYEAIALLLIEHPTLKQIQPRERGSESRLMMLIRDVCEAGDELDADVRVPEETKLRAFSKQILTAIEKNRADEK